ncbi:MAG TPA: hypothetical protein VH083_28375, partial [Myxococcales bacterium]|nr:hypothetical protein [Myxococcales bacterium]
MAGEKVDLGSGETESIVSRPLKTGASFTLVLPKRRFIYRHWDKEKYLPGEQAQLVLEGEGIGDEKYEFVVERADSADGPWSAVGTVEATAEGDKATAAFTIPVDPPKGRVTKVMWKRLKAKPGDQLGMHIEADNLEGGWLSIHVEKKNESGEWEINSRWSGTIENGICDTAFPVPPDEKSPFKQLKDGKVVELAWDGEPEPGKTAWLVAKTEEYDGSELHFTLERADAEGEFHEVGSAASSVKDNLARNSVSVPSAMDSAPLLPVRFEKVLFAGGEELRLEIDPAFLNGQGFEATLERRIVQDGSAWEEISTIEAGPHEEPATADGEEAAADEETSPAVEVTAAPGADDSDEDSAEDSGEAEGADDDAPAGNGAQESEEDETPAQSDSSAGGAAASSSDASPAAGSAPASGTTSQAGGATGSPATAGGNPPPAAAVPGASATGTQAAGTQPSAQTAPAGAAPP